MLLRGLHESDDVSEALGLRREVPLDGSSLTKFNAAGREDGVRDAEIACFRLRPTEFETRRDLTTPDSFSRPLDPLPGSCFMTPDMSRIDLRRTDLRMRREEEDAGVELAEGEAAAAASDELSAPDIREASASSSSSSSSSTPSESDDTTREWASVREGLGVRVRERASVRALGAFFGVSKVCARGAGFD